MKGWVRDCITFSWLALCNLVGVSSSTSISMLIEEESCSVLWEEAGWVGWLLEAG